MSSANPKEKPETAETIQDGNSGLRFKLHSRMDDDGFWRARLEPDFDLYFQDGRLVAFQRKENL